MNSLNTIAFRKGLIVTPTLAPISDPTWTVAARATSQQQMAMSLQAELMHLGYILTREAFEAVQLQSSEWITAYYNEVIPDLRKRLGNDRNYQPMYRNFPQQIMEMSSLQLFLNAIIHYWSDGTWEPPQDVKAREFKFENTEFKPIKPATEEQFDALFTRLVSLNNALTEDDKGIIDWFLANRKVTLPANVPFKETLCILAAKGLDVPVSQPTDVLRIAVHLSGGDISLPAVPKVTVTEASLGHRRYQYARLREAQVAARQAFNFKKFTRKERKFLLGLLEKTNPTIERLSETEIGGRVADMQSRNGRWRRLGERLHPGEYEKQFPKAAAAFKALRNDGNPDHIRSFAAQVDMAFAQSWTRGVDLLATRPGEFARRLDWLLRTPVPKPAVGSNILREVADRFPVQAGEPEVDRVGYVLDAFARTAGSVSGKVLFELYSHFDARSKPGTPRSIILKGKRAKTKTLPALPPLEGDLVAHVKDRIMTAIRNGFSTLPPMGNVWIDERLRKVPVPFSMRSVNTAIKTYVRGTRVPFSRDAKVIRAFIHWYDENGSEDLDLSAGLYGEKLNTVTHISFTNLRERHLGCCHSGDIRHRQGACAEYVDIPVQQALNGGVRYALIQVFNYNGRPMHSIKDTVFGLMEREDARANEIFVPKSIANCMGLANESSSVLVCIIDLKEREYIWADFETERGLPMLENVASKSADVLLSLVNNTKMTVYDLLAAHATARGRIVTDPSQAQVALRWEDFVTDYANVGSWMLFDKPGKPTGAAMTMNEYQQAVVGDGSHSMNSSRPCPACGDMDGCHVPARLARAGRST
jgi:hypothetical protein